MSGEGSETAKAEVTKEVPVSQEEKPAEPSAAAEKSPEKVRIPQMHFRDLKQINDVLLLTLLVSRGHPVPVLAHLSIMSQARILIIA